MCLKITEMAAFPLLFPVNMSFLLLGVSGLSPYPDQRVSVWELSLVMPIPVIMCTHVEYYILFGVLFQESACGSYISALPGTSSWGVGWGSANTAMYIIAPMLRQGSHNCVNCVSSNVWGLLKEKRGGWCHPHLGKLELQCMHCVNMYPFTWHCATYEIILQL